MKKLISTLLFALIGITVCSGEGQLKATDLMAYSELKSLAFEHKVLWRTIRERQDNRATAEQQEKSAKLVQAISAENERREAFYEVVEEGMNISDYPGLLEKLGIRYEKVLVGQGSKKYAMSFLVRISSEEGDPVKWITVDLNGKIVSKVSMALGQ